MQPPGTLTLSRGEQYGHYHPWKTAAIAEVGTVESTPAEEDIVGVGAADSKVVEEAAGSNPVAVVEALIAW